MDEATSNLTHWRHVVDQRDALVREAHAAGLNINRIHHLSGIARSTIYEILNAVPIDKPHATRARAKGRAKT